MCCSSVSQSAKLIGVTGSVKVRARVAGKLNTKFTKMVMDSFEKKEKSGVAPIVTLDEIAVILKKIAPNVNVDVKAIKSGSPHVSPLFDEVENLVSGFCVYLPFKRSGIGPYIAESNLENAGSLSHEVRHFFNFITEPKYATHFFTTDATHANRHKSMQFYEQVLYEDEIVHYDANPKLHEDKKARAYFVKDKIEKFFSENNCSSQEKIELLQKWRHLLKAETVAYKDGFTRGLNQEISIKSVVEKFKIGQELKLDYIDALGNQQLIDTSAYKTLAQKVKIFKSLANASGKADYCDLVVNELFIHQKIKIIEKMLAAELTKVRAEQKV